MRPITEPALNISYHSRMGKSAEENGDFCVANSFLLEGRKTSRQITLGLAADGLGAGAWAEEASQLAVQIVRRCFSQSDSSDVLSLLYQAFNDANCALYERGLTYSEIGGRLGTTLAAAVVVENRLYVANVGNSRIYLQQPGKKLIQITRDHTLGSDESLSADKIHPAVPKLARFLGQSPEVSVDFCLYLSSDETNQQMLGNQGVLLRPGSKVLLVTDGVTDKVSYHKIQSIISSNPIEKAAERLTQLAYRRDKYQDVSALIMQVPSSEPAVANQPARKVARYAGMGALGLAVLAALILITLQFGVPLVEGMLEPAATQLPTTSTQPAATKLTPAAPDSQLPLVLPTETGFPSRTPMPFATVTATPTATSTATAMPTSTPTPTPTPTSMRTRTPSPTVTFIPTWTPRPYVPPPASPTPLPPTDESPFEPTEEPTQAPPPPEPTDPPPPPPTNPPPPPTVTAVPRE